MTGRAAYGADLSLPGMLCGAVVRSPHAHARIVSIDTSRAERMPGVRAVIMDAPWVTTPLAGAPPNRTLLPENPVPVIVTSVPPRTGPVVALIVPIVRSKSVPVSVPTGRRAAVAPHAHRFVIDAAPNSVSPCTPEPGSEATKRIANRGSCDIGRIVRLTIHAEQILHMEVSGFDLSRQKNASSCATRQGVLMAGRVEGGPECRLGLPTGCAIFRRTITQSGPASW